MAVYATPHRFEVAGRPRRGIATAAAFLTALVFLGCAKGDRVTTDGSRGTNEATVPTASPTSETRDAEPRTYETMDRKAPAPPAGSQARDAAQEERSTETAEAREASRVAGEPDQALADAPLAPMGQEIGRSPLENSPGYTPPNDPEADAVRAGKRKVGPIHIPFTGGAGSSEALAEAILDGLARGDRHTLHELLITQAEFSQILWPEFPESRPITNIRAEDAWEFHHREANKGLGKGLSQWAGQRLQLRGISCEIGKMPFTNFTLYKGVVLHVLTESGEPQDIAFAEYFAERDGVWKVYLYKEK